MWHEFWVWVYNNAPTIQVVCAVLGIFGLFIYAADTRAIRRATLAQSEASRRPSFDLESATVEGKGVIRLKNTGVGLALDAFWTFVSGPGVQKPTRLGVCDVGTTQFLSSNEASVEEVSHPEFVARQGIRVTYTDTAGKRYWTEFRVNKIGPVMRTQSETGAGQPPWK